MEAWDEVDERQMRSFTIGQRIDLPEVVLLPGLGAPSYLYPWMQQLARWTRATVLDLPGWRGGRGRSSASTVAAVGLAAAHWLKKTARTDVILAGHSSGAQSAIRTAYAIPDRLFGLVLAGPTLDPMARHPAALLARTAKTVAHEHLSELSAVLPWFLKSGPPWLRLCHSVIHDRPEDLVAALSPPTLFLTGENDRLASPTWIKYLATLNSATCSVVPGGHNACYTNPRAVDEEVHQAARRWPNNRTPYR